MKIEPCGACDSIPSDWNWHQKGAHLLCHCGVSGPAVADAASFQECVPAWNAMWKRGPSVASKRVAKWLAEGYADDTFDGSMWINGDDDQHVIDRKRVAAFLRECGIEVSS